MYIKYRRGRYWEEDAYMMRVGCNATALLRTHFATSDTGFTIRYTQTILVEIYS